MTPILITLLAAVVMAFVLLAFANRRAAEQQADDPLRRIFLGTVLVAETHPTMRKILGRILRDHSGEVVVVADGQQAIEALDSRGFDLVISELHLDKVLGYEVCRRAKARHAATPVLMICGAFEPYDRAAYAACGADALLRKPFATEELLSLAARHRATPGVSS